MVRQIVQETLQVTAFVAIMMIAVEYVNVLTRGRWPETLATSRWKQYLIAAALGAMPGCLGAFIVVALYTHRMVSFGALVACMIVTTGDESFVMLAMFPRTALILTLALAGVGLATGMLTDAARGWRMTETAAAHPFDLHPEDDCRCLPIDDLWNQLRRASFARGVLVLSVGLFIVALVMGLLGPDAWTWLRWTLLVSAAFALFIVLTVPEHFLDEHLWRHVFRRHVPRIFAWTFGALVVIALLERWDPGASIIGENRWAVLGLAGLFGIIPESGPHLLFVTFYNQGLVPLGTLVASSIVQDGHGMLPFLAFSRIQFLQVKAINLGVGLMVGAILLWLGV